MKNEELPCVRLDHVISGIVGKCLVVNRIRLNPDLHLIHRQLVTDMPAIHIEYVPL